MAKKSKPAPTAKKKSSANLSRYNQIQSVLSEYAKENGIKLGREFSKKASSLYKQTKGVPLKQVQLNIEQLYQNSINPEKKKQYEDNIDYYFFKERIQLPAYHDVNVSFTFKDDIIGEVQFEGTAEEARSFYNKNLHRHLVNYYSKSPVARFSIVDSDNKNVHYEVQHSGPTSQPSTQPSSEPSSQKGKPAPKTKGETDKLIELEKEKQKTIEMTQKANSEKVKQIRELKEMGFSNAEIKEMLK